MAWACFFQSLWYLPEPGIEPMSPALADGFFRTEPPREPPQCELLNEPNVFLEFSAELIVCAKISNKADFISHSGEGRKARSLLDTKRNYFSIGWKWFVTLT